MGVDQFQSDALTRNLDLTNIAVVIPDSFQILEYAVKGYAGKEKQARDLLLEYHHKYRNWHFVVQETQRYAIGNLRLYRNSVLNGRVIYLLSNIFLHALRESERFEIRSLAADHLLAYWIKLLEEMPEELAKPAPGEISAAGIEEVFQTDSSCHQGIVRHFFLELLELPEAPFEFLMRSFYPPKRIGAKLLRIWRNGSSFVELRAFLETFFRNTYNFWLSREDPCTWLEQQGEADRPAESWLEDCMPLSHELLRKRLQVLETEVVPEPDHRRAVEMLSGMTDFHEIVQLYFHLPRKITEKVEKFSQAAHISMLIQLRTLEVKGLEAIHEDVLREINFEIGRWIRDESKDRLEALLDRILSVLGISLQNYPQAALQIIRTMGLEIMATDRRPLIDFFSRRIIRLGFQSPMLGRVSSKWQISVNPAHLPNVRIWLDIIKANPLRVEGASFRPHSEPLFGRDFRPGHGPFPEGRFSVAKRSHPARLQPREATRKAVPCLLQPDRRRGTAQASLHRR